MALQVQLVSSERLDVVHMQRETYLHEEGPPQVIAVTHASLAVSPKGGINNKRLRDRAGQTGADFPAPFIVEKPLNQNAK